MSPSSTPRLRPLERLLLDGNAHPEVEHLLTAIGFRVENALRVDLDIRDDVAVVKWARQHQRLLVTHDGFRDRRTQYRVNQEIRRAGGRVISLQGGPGLDPLVTVGVILLHRPGWHERLIANKEHGVARLDRQNWKFLERDTLPLPRPRVLDDDLVAEASARLKEYQPPPGRNRRRNPPRGGEPLL